MPGILSSIQYIKGLSHFQFSAIPSWSDTGLSIKFWWPTINKKYVVLLTDYVGIVRSNLRLQRALRRILLIAEEVEDFHKRTKLMKGCSGFETWWRLLSSLFDAHPIAKKAWVCILRLTVGVLVLDRLWRDVQSSNSFAGWVGVDETAARCGSRDYRTQRVSRRIQILPGWRDG